MLYIDLDTVVTGSLNALAAYDGQFGVRARGLIHVCAYASNRTAARLFPSKLGANRIER